MADQEINFLKARNEMLITQIKVLEGQVSDIKSTLGRIKQFIQDQVFLEIRSQMNEKIKQIDCSIKTNHLLIDRMVESGIITREEVVIVMEK